VKVIIDSEDILYRWFQIIWPQYGQSSG